MSDRLALTVPEVAARLGIGRTLCWSLVAAGEIPSLRLGRAVRVPLRELERWMAANTEAAAR